MGVAHVWNFVSSAVPMPSYQLAFGASHKELLVFGCWVKIVQSVVWELLTAKGLLDWGGTPERSTLDGADIWQLHHMACICIVEPLSIWPAASHAPDVAWESIFYFRHCTTRVARSMPRRWSRVLLVCAAQGVPCATSPHTFWQSPMGLHCSVPKSSTVDEA